MRGVGGSNPSTQISHMNNEDQKTILRNIALSVAQLSGQFVSQFEHGSLVTFSLVLDALVMSDATPTVFQTVKLRLNNVPYDTRPLAVLHGSLLAVCDLAVSYDREKAAQISAELLGLLSRPQNQN